MKDLVMLFVVFFTLLGVVLSSVEGTQRLNVMSGPAIIESIN